MTKAQRLNRDQLLAKYSDAGMRERIVELLDLRSFLLQCVIAHNYKISDDLNSTIALSEYGDATMREFIKKGPSAPDIPIKEAKLICFLEFCHLDFLVDPMAMEPAKLAAAIGKEITTGRIRLPFTHGPELYLKAARLFPDERSYLATSDTRRLLDDTSPGVFQMGHWVCGPSGVSRVSNSRAVHPTLRIPLQHCHDVSCARVHDVQLSTDPTAPINQFRPAAGKVLDAQDEEGSEFPAFFSELTKNPRSAYDDSHLGTLPYLVGGCFSDDELRSLLAHLLDNTGPDLRAELSQFGKIGRSADWVRDLSRAELIQQILHASDADISSVMDSLVYENVIRVPVSEVRRPPLYSRRASGAYGIHTEVSVLGLRATGYPDLAPLRLRRLVNAIFMDGEVDAQKIVDTQELDWQLRGVAGINLATRLDEYLRTANPDEVVRRLILTHRKHVDSALESLRLTRSTDINDDLLVQRILWKLGFEPNRSGSLDDQFREKQANFEQSVRSAAVSSIVDRESIRAVASNYFVALEELLHDTLSFVTWLLTTDHVSSTHPFQYDASVDGPGALRVLSEFDEERVSGQDRDPITFGDKSTLNPLCTGFNVLSALLEKFRENGDSALRPADEIPEFDAATTLQDFPFTHRKLFLDLTPESQAKILETLRETSRVLLDANVPSERNDQLHFRQTHGDLEKLLEALGAVRDGVALLEDAGFTRHLFYPDRGESDRWGRSTFYFTDYRDQEVALGRPSSHEWANLPSLRDPQYLVSSARFAESQEFVRVTVTTPSSYSELWEGFPQRRQASGRDRALGYETEEASGQRAPQSMPG